MASKQVSADAETTKKTEKEQKYSIETLKKACITLFGVTTSTYTAATYNLKGEYTVEEMRKHIKNWLQKEIKEGN